MRHFKVRDIGDVRSIEKQPLSELIGAENVFDALQSVAAEFPDHPALTFIMEPELSAPAQVLSYAALVGKSRQAANLFHSLGANERTSVAFLLPTIPEAFVTLWGAQTASRACPINYLLNAEHIAHLINAANATILVALGPHPQFDIWPKVEQVRAQCPRLKHVLTVGAPDWSENAFEALLAQQPADRLNFHRVIAAGDIAAYFHTGGTTGAPKLAQHTHGNQLHASWGAAQMFDLQQGDVMINGFPLFHVAGTFVYGLSALLTGANVFLPTLLGMRNQIFISRYWAFAEKYQATHLSGVPTVMSSLLNTDSSGADLRRVRCMLTGGTPLPTEVARAFEERHRIPVRNVFGMTECAGVISIIPVHGQRVPSSCGFPIPFTQVRALRMGASVGSGEFCAEGEAGILVIRGPNVGPGYTEVARNPGAFEDGWLVSGDIGHIGKDGQVYITGRAKDVIIRGGHNIDPLMIEEALLNHPAVQAAAAVGEPDEYAGELPVAFVSLRPGASVAEAELLESVMSHIAERPAVPKRITIVPSIPLTAAGKIYKPALRIKAMERVVRDRIARHVSDEAAITVEGVDKGSRLAVHFFVDTAQDQEAARAMIREVMGGFAIDYEIEAVDSYQPPV